MRRWGAQYTNGGPFRLSELDLCGFQYGPPSNPIRSTRMTIRMTAGGEHRTKPCGMSTFSSLNEHEIPELVRDLNFKPIQCPPPPASAAAPNVHAVELDHSTGPMGMYGVLKPSR